MTNNTTAARTKGRIAGLLYRDRYLYLLAAPAVVYFAVFHYLPMGGVVMAF